MALWGYNPSAAASALPPPAGRWTSLAASAIGERDTAAADLLSDDPADPLRLNMALLPVLLRFSDDTAGLQRCLVPAAAGITSPATAAIAIEAAHSLRHITDGIICGKSFQQAALLPLVGPSFPHLSPYIRTVLAQRLNGAGLVQLQGAIAPLASSYPKEPNAHLAAMALALAFYSAVKTPAHGSVACQRLFHLLPPDSAGPAAAIAGFLCGLYQGISGLSLAQYRLLETTRLPASSGDSRASMALPEFSQGLVAQWAGALRPQIDAAAIAPPCSRTTAP